MRFKTLLLALVVPSLCRAQSLSELWSVPLGEGFSSVALTDSRAYASYRDPGSSDSTLVGVDIESGEALWRSTFEDSQRKGQENYGGGLGPHAPPLAHQGRVFVLGYGGRLVAFDGGDGETQWSVHLVDDLGAKPVQFGFAASPVGWGDRVFAMTGGTSGVTAFDAATGEVAWRSAPHGASYVTPVLTTVSGELQLVCVFQDETVGLDPSTGAERWSVPHKRTGLTNFAMLTVQLDGGLVVSGQGNVGAQCIDVKRSAEGWSAAVRWHARTAPFSHGQVLERDGFVMGSNGSMLCALACKDGALAFKLRGYGECNLVEAGRLTLCLNEEGELAVLRILPERIDVMARRSVLKGKAWAAPVVLGDRVILRDAKRLVALRLPNAQELTEPLESKTTGYQPGAVDLPPAVLAFAHGSYALGNDRTARLRASEGTLSLWLPDTDEGLSLTPRSDRVFVGPNGGRLELELGESLVPDGIRWDAAGEQIRAKRRPLAPVVLDVDAKKRLLGSWRIASAIDAEIVETDGRIEATSGAYENVRFAVAAESERRVWLRAINAPYGIPEILIEVEDDGLVLHQEGDTVRGVRR